MDERRLLLAFSLSLLVLLAYQALAPAPAPAPNPPAAETPIAATPRPANPATASSVAPGNTGSAAASAVATKEDSRERRVEVLTRDLSVGFSNRGARAISWRLTQYLDARNRPEEMVQAGTVARPFDVETGDAAVDAELANALYVSSDEQLSVDPGQRKTLRFDYAHGGIEVAKTFTFEGSGYLVGVSVSVRKAGAEIPKKVSWGPAIANPTDAERLVRGYEEPAGVILLGSTVERVSAAKLKEPVDYHDVHWLGVDGKYFAAVWIPDKGQGNGQLRQAPLPSLANGEARAGAVALIQLEPSVAGAQIYVGPKDYNRLTAVGYDLAKVVPIGEWLGPIVVLFMNLLRWIHAHVGNYGWSVIWLTVLINLVMSPLRHYSIANGLKMAKIAPEMKVIQDRYRKVPALDPKRQDMQKEIGELYARHGMSMGTQMAVGCLPMLLTMPFLLAIWRVLQVSIDLRGASFLWIPDLSHTDPLFVTPVLMAVSMFATQRLTPTAMDPAQQRMMMIMPLILGVFVWAAPAGLNLYWFASNLCSVIQQLVTLRILRTREEAAKERRRR